MPLQVDRGQARAPDAVTLVAFATIVLLAGSNVVAVRFSNRELDPFWGAALRFLFASLLLMGAVAVLRLPLPRGRALWGAAVYGLLGFGAFYAFGYQALLRIPAGLASILLVSVPLLTIFLALAHSLERFRWQGLAGAALALGGIVTIFSASGPASAPLVPMLLVLASAAYAAEAAVLIKLFPHTHPITTNAVGTFVGAAPLLTLSLAARESWLPPQRLGTTLVLAYLVVPGTFLLFMLVVFAIKRWSASGVSYQFVLMPVVALSLSAWLEGERLSPSLLLGAALVLSGVYVGALMRPFRPASRPLLPGD